MTQHSKIRAHLSDQFKSILEKLRLKDKLESPRQIVLLTNQEITLALFAYNTTNGDDQDTNEFKERFNNAWKRLTQYQAKFLTTKYQFVGGEVVVRKNSEVAKMLNEPLWRVNGMVERAKKRLRTAYVHTSRIQK